MTLWRRLFGRDRLAREIDAELGDHVERLIADYRRQGLSEAEARRRALASFGGVDQAGESCREVWHGRLADELRQDRALRPPRPSEEPGVCGCRRPVARARHRRHHRDLFAGRRRPAQDAAGSRAAEQLVLLAQRVGSRDGFSFTTDEFRRLADNDALAGLCAFRPWSGFRLTTPAGAEFGDGAAGVGQLLRRARRVACARPAAAACRRPWAGRAARRGHQLRLLAAATSAGCRIHRSLVRPDGAAVHGGRRHAARVLRARAGPRHRHHGAAIDAATATARHAAADLAERTLASTDRSAGRRASTPSTRRSRWATLGACSRPLPRAPADQRPTLAVLSGAQGLNDLRRAYSLAAAPADGRGDGAAAGRVREPRGPVAGARQGAATRDSLRLSLGASRVPHRPADAHRSIAHRPVRRASPAWSWPPGAARRCSTCCRAGRRALCSMRRSTGDCSASPVVRHGRDDAALRAVAGPARQRRWPAAAPAHLDDVEGDRSVRPPHSLPRKARWLSCSWLPARCLCEA